MKLKVEEGNRQRSELVLEYEGARYTLRPEFAAVCTVEGLLGVSILQLIDRCYAGSLRLGDMAVILREFSRAGDLEIPPKIIERLVRHEIKTTSAAVARVLGSIFAVEKNAETAAGNVPAAG